MSGQYFNFNYGKKPEEANNYVELTPEMRAEIDKANAQKTNNELSQGLSGGGVKDPDKGISVQRQEPVRVDTGNGITRIENPDGTTEFEIDYAKGYDGTPQLFAKGTKVTFLNEPKEPEKGFFAKIGDFLDKVDQKVNQWTGGQIRRAGHGAAFWGGVGATAVAAPAIASTASTVGTVGAGAKLVGAGAVVAGTSSCTEKSEVDPPTIMKITEIVTNLNGENPKVNGEDAQYVAYGDKVKLQWGDGYSIDCDRETREALQNNPLNKLNTALQSIGVNTGVTNPAIITEVNGGQNSWSGVPMLGMQNMTRDFNAQSLAQMQVTVDFPQISEDGLLEVDDKGNHVVTQKQATISDATGKYSLLDASGGAVGKNNTAFVIKAEDGEEYLVQTQDQKDGEYGLNGNKVLVYYRKDGDDYKQAFIAAQGWNNGTVDIQQNDGFTNNVKTNAQGYDGLSDKLNAYIMKLSFSHNIDVTVK